MRKITVAAIAAFLLLSTMQDSFSQDKEEENLLSVRPIIEKGYSLAKMMEEKYPNLAIIKFEFDMVFDDNFSYISMNKGAKYTLAAFGDHRIEDLSLVIYKKVDGKWVEITRDDEHNNQAFVDITPSESSVYAVDLKVNKYAVDTETHIGHYGLIVCTDLNKR